jgi:hypothetical protein
LFGVAVELATLLESLSSHAPSGDNAVSQRSPLQQQIADQAVDTLHAAVLAGYRPATAFDNDDRLASLRDHPNFAAVTTIPGNRADMIRPVSNP